MRPKLTAAQTEILENTLKQFNHLDNPEIIRMFDFEVTNNQIFYARERLGIPKKRNKPNISYKNIKQSISDEELQKLLIFIKDKRDKTADYIIKHCGVKIDQYELNYLRHKFNLTYLPHGIEKDDIGKLIDVMKTNPDQSRDFLFDQFPWLTNTILKYVKSKYKIPNFNIKQKRFINSILSENTKRCPKCEQILSIDLFHINTGHCKKCRSVRIRNSQEHTPMSRILEVKKRTSKNNSSVEEFIKAKLSRTKQYVNRFAKQYPDSEKYIGTFDLTIENLLNLYNKQNGKCYYSGQAMTHISGELFAISIDRLDSEKSYNINNVVLCCSEINYMKQSMSVERFIECCKMIANTHVSK